VTRARLAAGARFLADDVRAMHRFMMRLLVAALTDGMVDVDAAVDELLDPADRYRRRLAERGRAPHA
jgi:hypothetical protein